MASLRGDMKRLSEKAKADPYRRFIDAMAKTRHDVGLDRNAGGPQGPFRHRQRLHRQDLVHRTVSEENRRSRSQFASQLTLADKHTGMPNDSGHRSLSPETNVERHHRPLRETQQHEVRLGQAVGSQLRVDESVKDRRRGSHPVQPGLRLQILDTEPLVAKRSHIERLRRVRGDQKGVRKHGLVKRRQGDEVVSVSANPM